VQIQRTIRRSILQQGVVLGCFLGSLALAEQASANTSSSCNSSKAANLEASLEKLKRHNDYKKSPQPSWVVRREASYLSELQALGCGSSGGASSKSTKASSNGSCSDPKAQPILAELAKLQSRKDYNNNPRPAWIVRREEKHQTALQALGCGGSGAASSKSANASSNGSCSDPKAQPILAELAKLQSRNDYNNNPRPAWIVRREEKHQTELQALGCGGSGAPKANDGVDVADNTPSSGGNVSGGKVNWRSGAACTNDDVFAAWRGSPVTASIGWAPHKSDWNAIINYFSGGNMNKFTAAKSRGKLVSIGLPMMPETHRGQFSACASGAFDGYFTRVGSELKKRGLGDIVLRVGWEANLTTYPWIIKSDVNGYKQCYRRIVQTLRKASPQLVFDWHNGKRTRHGNTASQIYPGNDVVDLIGLSYYDNDLDNRTPANFDKSARDGSSEDPHGIENWLAFAKSRGKKLAVGEWGVRDYGSKTTYYIGNGDNPVFVDKMVEFFRRNAGSLAYESYFNCKHSNGDVYMIYPTSNNPKAASAYRDNY